MAAIIEQEEIDKLRQEIESLRKELTAKEAILSFLESRKRESSKPEVSYEAAENKASERTQESLFDLDDLVDPSKSDRRTLTGEIKDVIKRFGDQEFTVAHVQAALQRLGVIKPEGKSNRATIASILSKLHDNKELERTFTGKGNVPHRYKNIEDVNDLI